MEGGIFLKIGITNDHRGLVTKGFLVSYLSGMGHEVVNYGTDTTDAVDFPDYAYKLGKGILSNEIELGIAICGTGIGMSIALNKMKGITCAKVSSVSEAILCKAHNNANAIAISEELPEEVAIEIIDKFINTPFSNIDRYKNRIEKIKKIENE